MKYLSIDIGGTYIKYGEVTSTGVILNHDKVATPKQNLADFLNIIYQMIAKYQSDIAGIGISVPGKVDERGTISFGGALDFLDGINLGRLINQNTQGELDVKVENDGKANLLAEMWRGAFMGVKNCGAVVLGTGIGGGIALNGNLIYGEHQQAGELSFMVNDFHLAGKDQLIGYNSSAVSLVRTIAERLGMNELNNGKKVFEAITNGNQTAIHLLESFCKKVAYLLVNIQSVVDLSAYVIGGGISTQPIVTQTINQQYDVILEEIPVLKRTLVRPQIVPSTYGNQTNLIGATYSLLEAKKRLS